MSAIPMPAPGARPLGEILKWVLNAERVRKITEAITGAKAETREADCSEVGDDTQCNQCKLEEGFIAPATRRRNIARNTIVNYHYQVYIANLHAGPEQFGFCINGDSKLLTDFDFGIAAGLKRLVSGEEQLSPERLNILEWHYNNVEFDGFWRKKCTVVDAKGRYAKHINEYGLPRDGFPEQVMFRAFGKEMRRQKDAISSAQPQASLEWHFMEKETYLLAVTALGLDPTVCHHTPFTQVIMS